MDSPHPATSGPSTGAKFLTAAVLALLAGAGVALSFTHRSEHRSTRTFAFAAPAQVAVDTDRADLTVVAGTGNRLEVVRDATWSGPDGPPTPTLVDGTLRLSSCSEPWWVRIGTYGQCSTSYLVTVPRGAPVAITADVADLTARGAFPSIAMSTDVGDQRLSDISSARVELRSNVGDIDVSFTTAPDHLVVDTDVGDVTVTLPAGRYAVRASTDVGDTSVDQALVDGASSRMVEVGSNVGDVTVRSR